MRAAVFAAGAGHIGDYSHCSWSVTGIGQFLPRTARHRRSAASARSNGWSRIGSRSSPRRRARIDGAGGDARGAPVRGARVRRLRVGAAARRRRAGPDRFAAASRTVARVRLSGQHGAAADLVGSARRRRPGGVVSRVAVCGGAGDSLLGAAAAADVQAYLTADLRHHPADEHRRASDVALIDVAHWASEFPWCAQAADVLRSAFRCGATGACAGSAPTPGTSTTPAGERKHESRSRTAAFAAGSRGSRCRAGPDGPSGQPTARAGRPSSGSRPSRSPPVTGWARCRLRWRTWTPRSRGSSRRSTAVRQREDRDRSLLHPGQRCQAIVRSAARTGDPAAPSVQPGGFADRGDGAPRGAAGQRAAEAAVIEGAAIRSGRPRSMLSTTTLADIDRPPTRSGVAPRRDRSRPGRRTCWRSTNGSAPAADPGRGCCRADGAGRAGSRSTAASWRGSRRPPTTRCCGARSATQSCCGSRAFAGEGRRRGRRGIARQPGAGRLRLSGVDAPIGRSCWPRASRPSARPPITSPNTAV